MVQIYVQGRPLRSRGAGSIFRFKTKENRPEISLPDVLQIPRPGIYAAPVVVPPPELLEYCCVP